MKAPKCLDCGFRHCSWEECGRDSPGEQEEVAPQPTPEPDPKIVKLLEDRIAQVAPGVLESVNAIVAESFQKGTVPDGSSGGLPELFNASPTPRKKKKRKSTPADVERVMKWRKKNPERYNAYMRGFRKRKKAEKEAQK